jgi:hypothetical protein
VANNREYCLSSTVVDCSSNSFLVCHSVLFDQYLANELHGRNIVLLNLIIDIGGAICSWILQDTEQSFNVPVWKVAWYVTTNRLDGPA